MELLPRTTRAQAMDVLSSQANLAGYKALVDAMAEYSRVLPMMMTAAGTVTPAKVFIIGAGVAGLQAIATARRMGAVVTATDVRPAAKEEPDSLGAKFFGSVSADAVTSGGYAWPHTNWGVLAFLAIVVGLPRLRRGPRVALYVALVWFGLLAIGYRSCGNAKRGRSPDSLVHGSKWRPPSPERALSSVRGA